MRQELRRIFLAAALVAACNQSSFKGSDNKVNQPITKSFTQDALPVSETKHVQGHLGQPQTEKFDQGEWGALDLLVVVDNSGSMKEEQAELSRRLEPLLSQVAKSDWQISVVTTDPANGCQRALIKKSDPQAATKFQAAVNAGTAGTGTERGILQATSGLKCNDWLRQGSTVAVLILADEDNCVISASGGSGCPGAADQNGSMLLNHLASIRQLGKDARVYGLLWDPNDAQCSSANGENEGIIYGNVITQTSGKFGSICAADYTPTLQQISQDVAQILKYEFDLGSEPDPDSLKVLVNGNEWAKFETSGKKIKFTEAPPFGAKVEIIYRHGAEGGLGTAFTVDKKPVPESIRVTVNGEDVPEDQIKWNEQTGRVELASPPAERSEVKIEYKERVELKNTYDIGKDVDPQSIKVVVAGKPVSDVTYAAATGIVTVKPAPSEGAEIKITFKKL